MAEDPFADIRDKRVGELTAEQYDRATELWLRSQIGPSESYWFGHLQALFKIIDRLRAAAPATNAWYWHDWRGGDCPVPPGTHIVALMGGGESVRTCLPEMLDWSMRAVTPGSLRHPGDIVRYRIVGQHELLTMEDARQNLTERVPTFLAILADALDVTRGELTRRIAKGEVTKLDALAALARKLVTPRRGPSLTITRPELEKALLAWKRDNRNGKRLTFAETVNMTPERLAAEDADALWARLS